MPFLNHLLNSLQKLFSNVISPIPDHRDQEKSDVRRRLQLCKQGQKEKTVLRQPSRAHRGTQAKNLRTKERNLKQKHDNSRITKKL